jgi:hypothetical protein
MVCDPIAERRGHSDLGDFARGVRNREVMNRVDIRDGRAYRARIPLIYLDTTSAILNQYTALSLCSMADLLGYHRLLTELVCPTLPETLRPRWMWELDLKEEVTAQRMLNEAHLTGLVLCRAEGLTHRNIEGKPSDLLGDSAIIQTSYNEMSMRVLQDAVEHVQMHMHKLLGDTAIAGNVEEHTNRLFTRLGHLLLPLGLPDAMFDDADALDVATDGSTTQVMSSNIVRWFLNVFVILFRHLEMRRVAEAPVPVGPRLELESFHIESSRDEFYIHSQHYDLPPAAALQYSCEFGQMLNSVSQITFYYFPSYTRRVLIPNCEVATGVSAIYSIAAALAMLPNVSVIHEDEVFGGAPGVVGHPAHAKAGWRAIIAPGTVFLLSPNGQLLAHENVLELLRAVPIAA